MEMLQLRYFHESALTENFSKTAEKYMVPVSSVSASIRRLEQELGTKLFIRAGNRVVLNEKGKRLLEAVDNALTQLDIAVDDISAQPTQKQTLSILCRCTRQTVVRKALDFHRMNPSVFFKVEFDDTKENYGKYDIILSEPDEELECYASFPWRRLKIQIEALKTDPLSQAPITLNQLRDRLFVTSGSQKGRFGVFAQACKKQGFTPKVFLECDDYTCWDIAVTSGTCLGLTVGNARNSSNPNMCYLDVLDFDGYSESKIYYKKEKYTGNIRLFLNFLKTESP